MTERQQALFELISINSLVGFRKTTQQEICETISGYEWNDDPTAHDHCSAIWTDIAKINESFENDKVIISKNFEYWIGSKEETQQFLKDLWKALAPRLRRYWLFTKKVGMDGLGNLFEDNEFYKCFNDYDIEMSKDNESQDNERQ